MILALTVFLSLIKNVVLATFSIELAGSRYFSYQGLFQNSVFKGFYISIFHSISSFCNAGFDILGDFQSLTNYNDDPVLLFFTSILVILGGLGFVVWKNLWEFPKKRELLLHTKVVLLFTVFLIVFGGIFFFLSEFNNPLYIRQTQYS